MTMARISTPGKAMKKHHEVQNVHFEGDNIVLTVDGDKKRFALKKVSLRLFNATESEQQAFEVSPSGYGIHWPSIDEDRSIDGLLGIVHHRKGKSKVKKV